jgi:hypothetical protein
MGAVPSPIPTEKTWGQVFKDPAVLITFWVTTQFFILILVFNFYPSPMAAEAKQVILQTYVVAFTACWGYWLGSSSGSRTKGEQLTAANGHQPPKPG